MEKIMRLIAVMVAAVLFAGCAGATGVARFNATPETYRVRGVTTRPEAMVQVAGQANVDRYNVETYRWAVQNGAAYPYAGGGFGNDYGLYYGGPGGWVTPQVAPPEGYLPGGSYPATRDEVAAAQEQADRAAAAAAEARRRADDSLRVNRIVVDRLRGRRGGAR